MPAAAVQHQSEPHRLNIMRRHICPEEGTFAVIKCETRWFTCAMASMVSDWQPGKRCRADATVAIWRHNEGFLAPNYFQPRHDLNQSRRTLVKSAKAYSMNNASSQVLH